MTEKSSITGLSLQGKAEAIPKNTRRALESWFFVYAQRYPLYANIPFLLSPVWDTFEHTLRISDNSFDR